MEPVAEKLLKEVKDIPYNYWIKISHYDGTIVLKNGYIHANGMYERPFEIILFKTDGSRVSRNAEL